MPSLKLSNLFRRGSAASSLRERAAATASRVREFKVAVADTTLAPPTSLAQVCDRAVVEWNAMPTRSRAEGWDDERTDEALSAYDAVFQRAIDEPSRDVAEIQAKARLLLHDLIEHTTGHDPSDEATLTVDDRLTRVVLREIIDLSGTTALTSPADPTDWHNPPPGFMASPAIEPMNFAGIPQGMRIKLERLNAIAHAEFRRLAAAQRETGKDATDRDAAICADLFLPALTAAVYPSSAEAKALAALSRPAGPDPVLALIEEHQAAYAEWDRLSEVWADMDVSTPECREAMAASAEPGRREVAAYDALFAARPTTLPGAVAFAEYLREATERTSYDVEPSDAERALAVVADALSRVAAPPQRPLSLVDRIDFAAASMGDLRAIHDTAGLLGEMAHAVCWQGRCLAPGQPDPAGIGANYNAAGELMHWLGEALTDVQSAAIREARGRRPTAPLDQETRLGIVARSTVENGDTDETAALISDLAIWLADDVKR